MKSRCTLPKFPYYKDYGGRGIVVCDEWLNSFENFYRDMGERPENTSLDRIDVNGNYEPGNCKWSSNKEQQRNRRSSHIVCVNGNNMCLVDACKIHGISQTTVTTRLKKGWDIDRALQEPVKNKRPRSM